MSDYTSEQFWKLYEKLPQELKNSLSSEETGNYIYDICKKNNALEKLEGIVKYVGQVLAGFLPPEDFQQALEKRAKLNKNVAREVAHEINRFIFFPVKESLAAIYKIGPAPSEEKEFAPGAKPQPASPQPTVSTPQTEKLKTSPEVTAKEREESEEKQPDTYREPIE